GWNLGEPQVGIANMTRQHWLRLSRDCQCRHVLVTCFLVWWLSFGLIRTRLRAVDPITVATDPGDFGSVAIWRKPGWLRTAYVCPRAPDTSVAAARRSLTAAAGAAVWAAWEVSAVSTTPATPTPNVLLIIVATLLSYCLPAGQPSAGSRMRFRG